MCRCKVWSILQVSALTFLNFLQDLTLASIFLLLSNLNRKQTIVQPPPPNLFFLLPGSPLPPGRRRKNKPKFLVGKRKKKKKPGGLKSRLLDGGGTCKPWNDCGSRISPAVREKKR